MDWIEANGASFRYELSGAGPRTLVLLHENTVSLESWDYVIEALRAEHRVLRYDLRGYGLSEKVIDEIHMSDEVSDLEALLEVLEIDGPVTLIGGAVGGAIALHFAAAHPERVKALVAMAPAAGVGPERQAEVAALCQRAIEQGMRPIFDNEIADGAYPPEIRNPPGRFERYRNIVLSTDPRSWAPIMKMTMEIDLNPILPQVKCPALIVGCLHDPFRTPASHAERAARMPQGRYVAIDTGHFFAMQAPELIEPVLLDFLAETASAH